MLLGEDLLPLLVLAIGAAMVAGNGLALVRPPPAAKGSSPARAPVVRTLVMITIGALAAVWALVSLVAT